MDDEASRRLGALEERLMYQERTIEELNEALLRQWAEIERLGRQIAQLEAQQADLAAALPEGPEPPPPHY